MEIIDFIKAKNNLKVILDNVGDSDNVIIIKRADTDDAVIISLKNYDSLVETLYLLKSPANAVHLAKSIAQYKGQ